MDFLASTNHFLHIFSKTPAGESFFQFIGNLFWNESFIRAIGEGYFCLMETATLLESFFSSSGNRHCYEWKQILKGKIYSSWWKLIFWLVETIFFHCLIYFLRSPSCQLAERYFSARKNRIIFYSGLSFLLAKTII